MPLTYIGSDPDNTNVSPFNELVFRMIFTVTISDDFTPTVKANTDFNGWYDFKISLSSSYITTYSEFCIALDGEHNQDPCSDVFHTID